MLALLQPKHQPPHQSYEGFPPSHDPNAPYDPAMQPYYYPAPPGHEGPYQPYAYPMLSPPEGQPPMPGFMPSGDANSPGGVPNLPPADIARTIPCRYVVFLSARHHHEDRMPRCASLRDTGASFRIFSTMLTPLSTGIFLSAAMALRACSFIRSLRTSRGPLLRPTHTIRQCIPRKDTT